MDGADKLMSILKNAELKPPFSPADFIPYFGKYLQKRFDVDYVYANELEIENGKLTGRHLAILWTANAKPNCCGSLLKWKKLI